MDQTAIRMTDVGKFPIPFFENNMKKNIMFTLVTTIKCLDIRAITWNKSVYPCKNVLLFFRDLLPGIWMQALWLWRHNGFSLQLDLRKPHGYYGLDPIMVNHHPAILGGHSYCDSGNQFF